MQKNACHAHASQSQQRFRLDNVLVIVGREGEILLRCKVQSSIAIHASHLISPHLKLKIVKIVNNENDIITKGQNQSVSC